MERNDFPADGPTQGSAGAANAGGGLGNTQSTQGYDAGAGGAAGGTMGTDQNQGFSDRARDIAGMTQDKLADVGSTVRERAGTMKDSLADVLESGAERLRQRVHNAPSEQSGQLAVAAPTGTVTTGNGRIANVGDKVASGMQATAEWIRETDLESAKLGIERQVKEHPGRTLLIAVGLGYLLGKAIRK